MLQATASKIYVKAHRALIVRIQCHLSNRDGVIADIILRTW